MGGLKGDDPMATWIWILIVVGMTLYGYVGGVVRGAVLVKITEEPNGPPAWAKLTVFFLTWFWPVEVLGYVIWAYTRNPDEEDVVKQAQEDMMAGVRAEAGADEQRPADTRLH